MRLSRSRPILAASFALLLVACGGEKTNEAEDVRQAGGEVLEGSISDAMIPLDQLRSQGEMLRNAPSGNEPAAAETPAADSEGGADTGAVETRAEAPAEGSSAE